jgi:hypothetical protein
MFDWFNDEGSRAQIFHASSFTYTKALVNKDLQRFVEYYQSQMRYVNNGHLLARLLLNIPVNFDRPLNELVQRVTDVMYQTCNPLGITTATNYGRVFAQGQFYNKGNEEIIFVHDTAFDADLCYANWRSLQPVHVMTHPFTDMSMQRCNGKYESDETGLIVIGINLPLLVVQYKAWLDEKRRAGSHLRIHHFIAMYVITNMVYTHMDLAYINRFANRYKKSPVSNIGRKHPFFISDTHTLIDTVIVQNIQTINKQSLTWADIAFGLELFTDYSLASFMKSPDVVPTRQILWALTVGYLPFWDLLCRLTVKHNKSANTFYTQSLKRYLRSLQSDKLLERNLPKNMQDSINDHILNGITPSL